MTRNGVQFEWGKEQEEAFETFRQKLIGAEVLDFPYFEPCKIFEITTDPSKYGLGAILHNGNSKPVAYASRMLNPAEQNYCLVSYGQFGILDHIYMAENSKYLRIIDHLFICSA